ncbi:TPA: hypothetical protein N0F65_004969 [Lagenidium giganteum]|uniref:Integrase zinc-binding domain-containing protein n=1 Tax=Lagenidium giganteum TaxID=4803 RepID=A0AAV2YLQ6_9STRA|nr:TPA: hypothetical protein N0F65_004969 [Lagenidium giganteum]
MWSSKNEGLEPIGYEAKLSERCATTGEDKSTIVVGVKASIKPKILGTDEASLQAVDARYPSGGREGGDQENARIHPPTIKQQDTKRRPEQPRGSDGEKKGAGAGKTKPTNPTNRKDKKPSAPRSGCLICKGGRWAVDCPTATNTQKEKALQAVKDKRQGHTKRVRQLRDTVNGRPELVGALHDLAMGFRDIWRLKLERDPPADINPMYVKLQPDAVPYRGKVRKYSPDQRAFIREFIAELEEKGLVYCNPNSHWGLPRAPRPQGGGFRFPHGRGLQARQPLGGAHCRIHTADVSGGVRRASPSVFGLFDYFKGFWQGLLAKACRELNSILTEDGVLTPIRILQAFCDSATHFQMEMQDCFKEMLHVAVLICIDVVLLFSPSPAEYLLNAKNCVLYTPSARWCGCINDGKGVKQVPQRLMVLQELPPPPTAAALQQFLCSLNGLRESMVDYARVVAPMQEKLEMVMEARGRRKVSLFVWPTWEDLRASQQRHRRARPVDARLEDGLAWVGESVWVPAQDREMILRLLLIAHCGAQAHRGEHVTLEVVRRKFAMDYARAHVKRFLGNCLICKHVKWGKLLMRDWQTTVPATKRNEYLHLHYLSMGPSYGDTKYVLVLKDELTHYCELVAADQATADVAVEALQNPDSQRTLKELVKRIETGLALGTSTSAQRQQLLVFGPSGSMTELNQSQPCVAGVTPETPRSLSCCQESTNEEACRSGLDPQRRRWM